MFRKSVVGAILTGLFAGSIAEPFLFDRARWHAFAAYPYRAAAPGASDVVAVVARIALIRLDAPVSSVRPPHLPDQWQSPVRARPYRVAFGANDVVPRPAPVAFLADQIVQPAALKPTVAIAPVAPATLPDPPLQLAALAGAAGLLADPDDADILPSAGPAPRALRPVQASAGLSWQPPSPATGTGSQFGGPQLGLELRRQISTGPRAVWLSSSAFAGLTPALTPDTATAQLAVGLRYQPLAGVNAVIGIDRMIQLGSRSRADWALTLAADRGANYDGPPGQSTWLHWHASANAAVIGLQQRDVFAQGQLRAGIGLALTPQWQLTPYLGAQGLIQRDARVQSRLDAGPGLWLRGRPDLQSSTRVDVRLSYAAKLLGTAAPGNAVRVELGLSY